MYQFNELTVSVESCRLLQSTIKYKPDAYRDHICSPCQQQLSPGDRFKLLVDFSHLSNNSMISLYMLLYRNQYKKIVSH